MSNELSTPQVVMCPAEYESTRTKSSSFAPIVQANANMTPFTNNNNVSYFVGVDAADIAQHPRPERQTAAQRLRGVGLALATAYFAESFTMNSTWTKSFSMGRSM